jgi:hypothetical protein
MTDKQIIIDGIKTSKVDFIDNFSIELTNRNVFEREQIGDKYFEIILAKEQECEELKNFHINLVGVKECEIKELFKLKQTLAEIKEIITTALEQNTLINLDKILRKINEVMPNEKA